MRNFYKNSHFHKQFLQFHSDQKASNCFFLSLLNVTILFLKKIRGTLKKNILLKKVINYL